MATHSDGMGTTGGCGVPPSLDHVEPFQAEEEPPYRIGLTDADGQLVNGGRVYQFDLPASCSPSRSSNSASSGVMAGRGGRSSD